MDLLKYLEPMKNLTERFSNLAFWRGVRKLRDEVVNAFEYVDSWGTHLESLLPCGDYIQSNSLILSEDEYQASAFSYIVSVLNTNAADNTLTILPMLSLSYSPLRINMSTEKGSILIGKHIDAVQVEYLSKTNFILNFVFPNGSFQPFFSNGNKVNGYSIAKSSVASNTYKIASSDLSNYENATLQSVTVYYH